MGDRPLSSGKDQGMRIALDGGATVEPCALIAVTTQLMDVARVRPGDDRIGVDAGVRSEIYPVATELVGLAGWQPTQLPCVQVSTEPLP